MKFKQAALYVLSSVLTISLYSCGSSSQNDQEKNSEEFKEAEKSLKNQIEDVVYNIPSPSEIPYILQGTGAEFNQSLLNPKTKVDNYTSRNDKASLNLGVYAADIGYLSSYSKTQEAIDYLSACKKLADNLNVIGSFDTNILKRFEANISDKDSLAILLNAAIQQTEAYLKDDKRNKLAAHIVAGSFIEGLYISTGVVKTYPKDILPSDERNVILTNIIRVILEQRKSVSELLNMLSTVEQTEPIATLVTGLKKLDEAYKKLNIEEKIKNNRGDLVLSDANLVEITSVVESMRKTIVD